MVTSTCNNDTIVAWISRMCACVSVCVFVHVFTAAKNRKRYLIYIEISYCELTVYPFNCVLTYIPVYLSVQQSNQCSHLGDRYVRL